MARATSSTLLPARLRHALQVIERRFVQISDQEVGHRALGFSSAAFDDSEGRAISVVGPTIASRTGCVNDSAQRDAWTSSIFFLICSYM